MPRNPRRLRNPRHHRPRLREPLQPEHVKPRLLGHFGTAPGLNLIYVHLNRAIRERELDAIFITGPGHGGPANVAQAYLTSGEAPARQGNAHLQIVPYQLFQTADGWLVLNVGNDGQWRAFCDAAEERDLVQVRQDEVRLTAVMRRRLRLGCLRRAGSHQSDAAQAGQQAGHDYPFAESCRH